VTPGLNFGLFLFIVYIYDGAFPLRDYVCYFFYIACTTLLLSSL